MWEVRDFRALGTGRDQHIGEEYGSHHVGLYAGNAFIVHLARNSLWLGQEEYVSPLGKAIIFWECEQ